MHGIKTPGRQTLVVVATAGGNQAEVGDCQWMLTQSRILILDEPTRGIDVGAKSEIYAASTSRRHRASRWIMVSSKCPGVWHERPDSGVQRGRAQGDVQRDEVYERRSALCSPNRREYHHDQFPPGLSTIRCKNIQTPRSRAEPRFGVLIAFANTVIFLSFATNTIF
jgi:ABC-type glutathione transport system ATPase component